MKNRQEIDQWLKENFRKLEHPGFMFGVDNNQSKVEDFETADLRVLVASLSTGETRAVSNTFNALYTQLSKAGNVFVDYSFLPTDADFELLEKADIPVIFGNVSHAPIQDYDLVLVSHSIVPELFTVPRIYKASGVPYTIQERDKLDLPLIVHGGAAANEASIVYGKIYDKDNNLLGHSLFDMAQYGYAEGVIPVYVKEIIKMKKEEGLDPIKDKLKIQEELINRGICKENLFHVRYYDWEYEEDNFTIKEIKCSDPRLPKTVKYNRINSANQKDLGWEKKVFHLDGSNASSVDIQCSSGCSGQSSVCSFCMEATVAGGYHEIPLEEMKERMWRLKRECAPNTSSLFSYNINYYYKFMDIIKEQAQMFSGISLLNERLDVVAHAPEQLKLAKAVGLKRFSGAVEGMGTRVRNGIFNKNLDRPTLMKAMENIMDLKLMMVKFGMIRCGQENQEDIDEFLDELDEICQIRNRKGANSSLQMNFTPLVFYSQIALRHLPRITAEESYNEVKNMGYFLDKVREISVKYDVPIRAKFNGKGPGTYIEQLILDFGPAGTNWLIKCTEDGLNYVRGFGKKDKEIVTKYLQEEGYDVFFFTKARPKDFIFPNDHIEYATQEVKDEWWRRTEQMNFHKQLCLKTLANPNPKCHGCKMCEPKHIINMIKRPVDNSTTVEEVLATLTDTRANNISRIVVQKAPGYDYVSSQHLAHYVASRFLQRNDDLVDSFHKISDISTNSVTSKGQKDLFGGTFTFDINWKYPTSQGLLDQYIEDINKELVSCQVKAVYYNVGEGKSTNKKSIAYLGIIEGYSLSRLKDKYVDFDWEVKVPVKAMGTDLTTEKKHLPELKDKCLFIPYRDKIMCYFLLPEGVNPYLLVGTIINKGYGWTLENCQFKVMNHTQEVDAVCKCGQPLTFSRYKNSTEKLCPMCQGKIMLKQLSSK